MDIRIENETEDTLSPVQEDIIKSAVVKTCEFENFFKLYVDHIEVSVLIVTNDEIKRLNKKHRHIDSATDVLSFPMFDFENQDRFGDEPALLGDIVISFEKAKSQAFEYGHSIEREIGFLTVHSMLHLLGYDHQNEEEEKEMFDKQKKILELMKLQIKF